MSGAPDLSEVMAVTGGHGPPAAGDGVQITARLVAGP